MTSVSPLTETFVHDLRDVVAGGADAVAEQLRRHLSDLRPLGDNPPAGSSTILHAEPALSVLLLTWTPGQQTPIHDHLAWGAVAVLRGREHEVRYADRGDHLAVVAETVNPTGDISGFTPPGDIHRISNDDADLAVSLHVYGVDLREVDSSVRRRYDLPVR